ncbi:unnamed protein product [Brassica oleracea var. botrytis]
MQDDEDRSEGLNSFREINRYYYKPDSSRCRRDTDLVRKTKPEHLRRKRRKPRGILYPRGASTSTRTVTQTKPMRKMEERKKKPSGGFISSSAAAESPVGL